MRDYFEDSKIKRLSRQSGSDRHRLTRRKAVSLSTLICYWLLSVLTTSSNNNIKTTATAFTMNHASSKGCFTRRALETGLTNSLRNGSCEQTNKRDRWITTVNGSSSSLLSETEKQNSPVAEKKLVLVGGGHAHLQVIKALNKQARPENLSVTLVDVQSHASYSGMVPGCVANLYTPEQATIDLAALAEWASVEFIQGRVADIDLDAKQLVLHGSDERLNFDAISLDIGSTSKGLDETEGAKEFAIPTRPISDLVHKIELAEQQLKRDTFLLSPSQKKKGVPIHVVVVGGGAAGIELSMAMQARWGLIDLDAPLKVTLLNAGSELLSEENIQSRAAVNNALSKRHISVRNDSIVQRLTEEGVCLKDGTKIPYTHCIWAAGAIAHGLAWKLQSNKLAVSDRGWVSVTPNLQSVSHPFVFAAGDCAEILGLPNGQCSPPKAGVYAVRSGPVLIENLTRFLNQETKATETDVELIEFLPQNEFLKLIMCGDETAIGFRFGMVLEGKWVWQLKDRIDNMFMDLFRAEHLPSEEQKAEGRLDASQYDTIPAERPPPLDPRDAAILLQRTDDHVPYEQAWDVLRDMMESEKYRARVTSAARHVIPQPR
eukprot:scaffold237144_cov38-Attheya_sp.AAC.1